MLFRECIALQKVMSEFNDQLSEVFDVNVGVHQGSVLNPLLFIHFFFGSTVK